jgi:hypothetical protein
MALGSTQPLTEMSFRNLPRGGGQPAHKADILSAICELIVYKMWEPQCLTALWASTACYRDSSTHVYLASDHDLFSRIQEYELTARLLEAERHGQREEAMREWN